MSLAERVIVMDMGRIVQQGTPFEIYGRPESKFVAEFIGRSNWFSGHLGPEVASGVCAFNMADGLQLFVPTPKIVGGHQYEVCVRPERVNVRSGEQTPASDMRNSLTGANLAYSNRVRGIVIDTAYLGPDIHLTVRLDSGQRVTVTENNRGQLAHQPGALVALCFGVNDCIVLPVSTAP
jgi:ABC-type Fe3+/spermidine/putrescine transport system ATPase subunit